MGDRIENPYVVLVGILAGVAKPRDLPLALLEEITGHFSEERIIGKGGFGMVYKGLLHNGNIIAVKKLFQAISSSQNQFENEVNLLMNLEHQNIVRLVGYCYETRHLHMPYEGKSVFAGDTECLLCLEYLPNGSLNNYISDASSGLNWHTRCKIIEGISYGLQYLHEHSNEPIIHLDLKPANILLDENMLPKITDFGLSRLFARNKTIHTATTRGTLGYMSPEFLRGIITPMSDIFSLGVIIMEVITGHRDYPYDIRESSKGFIVPELEKWRNRLQKEPGYASLETDCQQIERCIQIGLICVNPERSKRPTMKKIIDMLEGFESTNWYISNKDIASSSDNNTIDSSEPQEGFYFQPLESILRNQDSCFTSDRTVDLATGAIGSLLPKLTELLNKLNLEPSMRSDVGCVIKDLRVMRVDRCSVSEVQRDNNNEQIRLGKLWADKVRELSYAIEDVVDGLLMYVEGSEPATSTGGLMGLIQKMMSLFNLGRTSNQIGGTIKDMKNQVEEVVANTVSTINVYHLSALVKDREKLFGIDDAMKEFTMMLRGADVNGDMYAQDLKVYSIFGSAGMGKTTLARSVYSHLKGSFRLTAFVLVGRNSNVKKLFHDILFELDEKQRYIDLKKAKLDERQLINEVKMLLENHRYLIVIDDLGEKEVWHDFLQFALVDSKCGSKIIITTRTSEVATIGTDVYTLAPLSHGYAEELFYATLTLEEGRCDVTDEVIEKILSKCGGVPLAIITIARLLASKQREDWLKVYNSIGFGHGFNDDAENTRKILLFSYGDLPLHLRTCLLHLSMFQGDKLIDKHMVIWKWVAECFVDEEPGRGLFELGERYFNQLVSRSMIQLVVQTPVSLFRIHDLVTDMICSSSKDENFVTVLEGDEEHTSLKNNARRLVVQKRYIEPLTGNCMVQLRSFYATDCYIDVMPPLSSFKVLRVLSIQGCKFIEDQPDLLAHIGKLLQLRYLGLEDMPIHELPEEIGNLVFLQTLILNRTMINELPCSVGRLKQMKCLRATICYHLRVPDWMVNMTSLEDLALVGVNMPPMFAEGLGKLKELRHLQILVDATIGFYSWDRALVESIGNLLKLQSLQVHGLWGIGDYVWEGFVPPRHLHSMTVWTGISRVPRWMGSTHLPGLSYLELDLLNMETGCLEILGRSPLLHTLKLHTQKGVLLVVTGSGAFPKLRHLYSRTMLTFQRGVMPRLEYLELVVGVRLLEEANFDCDFTSLGNLHSLQKVRVELEYWNSTDDPKYEKRIVAAVKLAVDRHPRRPIVHWNRTIERSH